MADSETLPAEDTSGALVASPAKARFSQALDDARAGASALGKSVGEKTGDLKALLGQAWEDKGVDLLEEAKAIGTDAKARAAALATDGKARASDALSSLGKLVADNAGLVDDKLGAKYGDYARAAARSIQEASAKLDSKELEELGEDTLDYIRKNPAVAVGLTAVAGFIAARALKKSDD